MNRAERRRALRFVRSERRSKSGRQIPHREGDTYHLTDRSFDQMQAVLRDTAAAFRKKFGRDPGPDDPLCWDPDADTPQPWPIEKYDEAVLAVMAEAGIRGELVYAYKKTGRLVSAETYRMLTRAEKKEWNDAIDEYFRLQPDG